MCRSALVSLTLSEGVLSLEQALTRLHQDWGMLGGLSVSFGTANHSQTLMKGLSREALLQQDAFVESRVPLSSDSLFDLASLTKMFTLVCMMQLIEQGKISLDDDVAALDPRFIFLKGTNVYEVLSYQAVLKTSRRIDEQADVEAAEGLIFDCKRHVGPEPERLYSDMNAMVCKYLVESVSGMAFEAYLKARVLAPLGMNSTFASVPVHRLGDCVDYNYEHRIIQGEYVVQTDRLPGLPHDPKARLLMAGGRGLCGHAGLFSTAADMVGFAQGLLSGALLNHRTLLEIGKNRTGRSGQGPYRQYMGYLCFAKSAVERLSEVPPWMGDRAFALSGYTGNHLAIDPQAGVFDLLLGNRCHMRVSAIEPREQAQTLGLSPDGVGEITWPDGRRVKSSFQYVYQKDNLIHLPVAQRMRELGWMKNEDCGGSTP